YGSRIGLNPRLLALAFDLVGAFKHLKLAPCLVADFGRGDNRLGDVGGERRRRNSIALLTRSQLLIRRNVEHVRFFETVFTGECRDAPDSSNRDGKNGVA